MAVFLIRTVHSEDDRVMEPVWDALDAIPATEITEGNWLLIDTPEGARATFSQLKAEFPKEVLTIKELHRNDLVNLLLEKERD